MTHIKTTTKTSFNSQRSKITENNHTPKHDDFNEANYPFLSTLFFFQTVPMACTKVTARKVLAAKKNIFRQVLRADLDDDQKQQLLEDLSNVSKAAFGPASKYAWNPDDYKKHLNPRTGFLFVCQAGSQVIGLVCGLFATSSASIYQLAVLPGSSRGRGVGTRLCNLALDLVFGKTGICQLCALRGKEGFYQSHFGFEICADNKETFHMTLCRDVYEKHEYEPSVEWNDGSWVAHEARFDGVAVSTVPGHWEKDEPVYSVTYRDFFSHSRLYVDRASARTLSSEADEWGLSARNLKSIKALKWQKTCTLVKHWYIHSVLPVSETELSVRSRPYYVSGKEAMLRAQKTEVVTYDDFKKKTGRFRAEKEKWAEQAVAEWKRAEDTGTGVKSVSKTWLGAGARIVARPDCDRKTHFGSRGIQFHNALETWCGPFSVLNLCPALIPRGSPACESFLALFGPRGFTKNIKDLVSTVRPVVGPLGLSFRQVKFPREPGLNPDERNAAFMTSMLSSVLGDRSFVVQTQHWNGDSVHCFALRSGMVLDPAQTHEMFFTSGAMDTLGTVGFKFVYEVFTKQKRKKESASVLSADGPKSKKRKIE
jgi:predicted N-acetyltransferase YhbS